MCGYNIAINGTATIANCDNTGTVTATGSNAYVGGVCGWNYAYGGTATATIANCTNNGEVSGSGNVGGVCGYNYATSGGTATATIANCKNKGNVSGSEYVGGVCGYNYATSGGTATISNCICTETVSGSGNIGCFCGYNSGTIENCTAIIAKIQITELTLTAENLTINAGGITGMNEKGIIRNSKSENLTLNLPKKLSSTESGRLKANLGGVSGTNDEGNISNCTNNKLEISLLESAKNLSVTAGGVCGTNTNTGTLSSCSNSGDLKLKKLTATPTISSLNTSAVMYLSSAPTYLSEEGQSGESGEFVIGGVVGTNENSTVENSYNTGAVSTEVENATVGGVTGQNTANGTTQSCYNSGTIFANGSSAVTGGVCGNNESGTVASCYFNSENSTTGVGFGSGSATGIPSANFSNGTFCESIGYHSPQASNDFKCIHCDKYEPAKYNNGTYEISNASQLYWFAGLVNGTLTDGTAQNKAANAVLTDNIVVNSNVLVNGALNTTESANFTSWTPIGNSSSKYTGTFDGKGFTISGLYYNSSTDNVGLFGYVGYVTDSEYNVISTGKVSNVGVVDSYFKGGKYIVGGVCGVNSGTITNCYNTGNVSGSYEVGGVCGVNSNTITSCYNTGNVSGTGDVGGVCGINGGTITNCYNTGEVSGSNGGGGVCGNNSQEGTITNCYNTGNVTATGNNAVVGGVCEHNENTITNCYFLKGKASFGVGNEEGSAYSKTTAQFQSGEVAYLLNGSTSEGTLTWGQQIGTDNYPVLGGAKVYQNVIYEQCEGAPGTLAYSYENEQKDPVYQEHSYNEGICTWCGEPEACQHVAGISVRTNIVAPTCTYYGYYTRITYCALCGGEMSRKIYYTMPTGHDCTSGGICKTCGVPANGRDGFKSASLTLTDGVILNYYLLLSDEALADTGAYIHFTSPQGVDSKIMLSEGIEDNGRYKFSLELRPDQMADVITAQVVYSDDVQGSSINYSVQKYLENADSSVSELADAMMNFGAFTQLYTGRNTDNLAADVADYTVNASIGDEYKHKLSGNASGITVKGATLQIGAYTTIRVKYQLAQGEDISKYTFKCGDTILEPEKSGDYYYVYLRNIRPQNLDEMYSFTVTDGTNTATLKYSAFSYMKNILDNADKYDKNIVNLMNAMYDYNKAADAYNN